MDFFSACLPTMSVGKGGTGATSLAAGKVLVGDGGNAVQQPPELHWDSARSWLGVGTDAPMCPLHVASTATAANVSIYCSGDVVALSDARVKTDFRRVADALDRVAAINGYTFARADDRGRGRRRMAGVVAQEVLAVLPEVVHTDDAGMHSVAYGNMAALFVEAIKDLKRSVDDLRAEVAQLRSSIQHAP